MQIRISLIPALGLNGVSLIGVCSLFRVTCDEDWAVAQEAHGNRHRNTFDKIIVLEENTTPFLLSLLFLHQAVELQFTLMSV